MTNTNKEKKGCYYCLDKTQKCPIGHSPSPKENWDWEKEYRKLLNEGCTNDFYIAYIKDLLSHTCNQAYERRLCKLQQS